MTEFSRKTLVVRRIRQLLGSDPSHLTPVAGAQLAQLRRALGRPPGSVPEVWALTLEEIPDSLPAITREREEWAIHVALTHFAAHQQSRRGAMHVEGRPFATAVRLLALEQKGDRDIHETPAYLRLVALASTSQLPTAVTHARGLINQLRSADLGFDYGRYADDLYWLQVPGQAVRVQRDWGRDFHRTTSDTTHTRDEGDDA